MKKREYLIMGILFLAWTMVTAVIFMHEHRLLWLCAGIAGALAVGICLSHYIDILNAERDRLKGRKCRMCGQRKPAMALEFGEDEGLCRECLEELIPLIDSLETKAEK